MKVTRIELHLIRVPFDMGGSTDGVCRDELDFSGLPVRAFGSRRSVIAFSW
jgi:hypothetical protein